jgi:hypothetical protein
LHEAPFRKDEQLAIHSSEGERENTECKFCVAQIFERVGRLGSLAWSLHGCDPAGKMPAGTIVKLAVLHRAIVG